MLILLSTKIGFAPILIMGRIQDIIVKDGSIISSFFFIFKESNANCKATVPLLTAIAYLRLTFFANSNSNLFIYFPVDEM